MGDKGEKPTGGRVIVEGTRPTLIVRPPPPPQPAPSTTKKG